MSTTAERLAQARLDLQEVESQLAAGDLDRETADRLTATYQREIDFLVGGAEVETPATPSARSWRRAVIGTVLVAAAVTAISVAVVQSATERDGGFITGSGAEGVGVDLDSISNETMAEVIAANLGNPQINQMRLALAGRYFDEGNQQEAFRWYDEVLQSEPAAGEASQALGRIGWLVHVAGDSDLAEQTLLRALELVPDNVDARFFLGRVYADSGRLEDAEAAWLVIANDTGLSDEIRDVARSAIDGLAGP